MNSHNFTQHNVIIPLFQYYIRARHMALKALDVTYTIPTMGEVSDVLEQDYKVGQNPDYTLF